MADAASNDRPVEPLRQSKSVRCGFCGHDPYEPEAVLVWTCETCGWSCAVPMPGYAGDGYRHYSGPSGYGCGPLVARRAPGFLRLHPGTTTPEIERALAEVADVA